MIRAERASLQDTKGPAQALPGTGVADFVQPGCFYAELSVPRCGRRPLRMHGHCGAPLPVCLLRQPDGQHCRDVHALPPRASARGGIAVPVEPFGYGRCLLRFNAHGYDAVCEAQ